MQANQEIDATVFKCFTCVKIDMLRLIKADKVNGIVTLEMNVNNLRNLIESVDVMIARQQQTLLENLPSEDEVRQRLDDYKALKEDLEKIWGTFMQ